MINQVKEDLNKNILSTIGNTPCLKISKEKEIYVKLENINPTGSIADRLILDCSLLGDTLHYVGPSMICASVCLLGSVLDLPVYISSDENDGFERIASSIGNIHGYSDKTNIFFNEEEIFKKLIQEIKDDIPNVSDIHISDKSPLIHIYGNMELNSLLGVKIHTYSSRNLEINNNLHPIFDKYTSNILDYITKSSSNDNRVHVIVSVYDGVMDFY